MKLLHSLSQRREMTDGLDAETNRVEGVTRNCFGARECCQQLSAHWFELQLCGQLDLQQGRIRPRVDQKIERAATVYINRYHDKVSVPGAEPHRELSIRACRGKREPGH